ncbi:alpha/beta hydrolase [Saccharospirillum salsuginis]|uniref:Esterase n=1 Tax=Saccharospirillum salsuginis TaxID=418750 RepID=A0A918NH22_9GAMM|nr:alpha/beta hydrolase [Saccharospirillum salsuginis]GGX66612.1 esterase [Saccharospirillum salsuginis]
MSNGFKRLCGGLIRSTGVATALLLAGCTLPALNLVTPDNGYTLTSDVEYGDHERQRMDVYRPTEPLTGAPTVVFFYGGSWQWGYKEGYRFVAQALAEEGYRVVVPDYRLNPEVMFPAFIEDGAAAVARAVELNLGDNGLVLMGHSAGAHTAALLALDERYLVAADVDRSRVTAWIGLSGPYDFLPLQAQEFINVFGAADGIPETQPVNFVSEDDPPALLIWGEDDSKVARRNIESLSEALRSADVPVQVRIYAEANHYDPIGAFSVRFRDLSPGFADVMSYLNGLSGGIQ